LWAIGASMWRPWSSWLPTRPLLNRLRQMRRLDLVTAGQVRNRPRQLQDAVVGSGAHVQLFHCRRLARRARQALADPCLVGTSSSRQMSRTSPGLTPAFPGASALASIRVPSNRAACQALAVSTRARTAADGSPSQSSDGFSYSTRGTSMWMSTCALYRRGPAAAPRSASGSG
jgi:hypothetical protein